MASLCNIFLQFRQLFKGLRVSNHKVRVSNYLVRASNPLLVIPKKFSAALGKKVRGLAQLITYTFAMLYVCFDIVYQIKQRAGKEKYTPTAEIVNETVLKFNKAAEVIPGKADRSNLNRMVQRIRSLQVSN